MNKVIFILLSISLVGFFASAADYDYNEVIGDFNGYSVLSNEECSIHSEKDAANKVSIEVTVGAKHLKFPRTINADEFQRAIDSGYEGQFYIQGPQGWIDTKTYYQWSLSGSVFTKAFTDGKAGKLNFLKIQYSEVDKFCYMYCDNTIDLLCGVKY